MAGIKISVGKNKILYILGVYRPPAAQLDNALALLADALEEIPNNNSGICIFGDLNVNDLVPSRDRTAVNELLASFHISRIPLPPTRITPTSATSIDIVCTDLDSERVSVEVLQTGLSDHTGQMCILDTPHNINDHVFATRRNFSKENLTNLAALLSLQSWEIVFLTPEADEAYSNFICILTTALDIACPLKKVRNKKGKHKNLGFQDSEVQKLRSEFLKAQEIYLLTAKENDRVTANQKKKEYDLKLKQHRKEANEQHIAESSNKSKAIWNVINSERLMKKKVSDPAWQLNIAEETIEELSEVAEHFNQYFTNIADETLSQNSLKKSTETGNYYNPQNIHTSAIYEFQATSADEIIGIINELKPKTSTGIDGISSKLLKFCKHEVSKPIADIVNKSFRQGVFPTELKTSKVYPLHKQGSKKEIQNYRPISLVPTVSKIIEKVALSRLTKHLEANNLVPERQHGFIAGRSTASALIDLVEHMIDSLEQGNTITSVFLDLSKAFDCLDHKLMLSKISSLGIKGMAQKWFENYLQGRKQVVEIKQVVNGTTQIVQTGSLEVRRGVPQGSVLGPVLFVLYLRDLQDQIGTQCYPISYADDTVLVTKSKSVQELEFNTNASIDNARQYCLKNDLVFNAAKTKCLTIGRYKDEVLITPDLKRVQSTKHLGMTIDDRLSWNCHVDALCSKLSSALFVLKRMMSVGTPDATRTAYHALFETHIRYGLVIWGGSSAGNLQRVLVLQKRAVRIMAKLNPRDSCRETFKNFGIHTVVALYIFEVITYASKLNLLRNSDVHEHQTRRADDFKLPAHQTVRYTKKPSFAGAELFNMIPRDLKICNPQALKKKLINWTAFEPFYSIAEFKIFVRDKSF